VAIAIIIIIIIIIIILNAEVRILKLKERKIINLIMIFIGTHFGSRIWRIFLKKRMGK
jgi:hypothetical protein